MNTMITQMIENNKRALKVLEECEEISKVKTQQDYDDYRLRKAAAKVEKIQEISDLFKEDLNDITKDMEPKAAEIVNNVAKQVIDYIKTCVKDNIDPAMLKTVFENISEETVLELFSDPEFNLADYINNPDKYLKKIREVKDNAKIEEEVQEITTEEQAEAVKKHVDDIVENLKAAKNPVSPIIKPTEDGKVEVDFTKLATPVTPVAQEPLRPTAPPTGGKNKKDKKKDNLNPSKEEEKVTSPEPEQKKHNCSDDHSCSDPNCNCHQNPDDVTISWPMNIMAYFDISSLFMVKNKEKKKMIGERISRAFDNLDTLQELYQYAGDAPTNPFGFKLTSVKDEKNFILTTDRTINGKYTKLTFSFFDNGATITAA